MKKVFLGFAIFALCFSGIASAELYKWVDKEGVVHVEQAPPRNQKYEVIGGSDSVTKTAPPVVSATPAGTNPTATPPVPAAPAGTNPPKKI